METKLPSKLHVYETLPPPYEIMIRDEQGGELRPASRVNSLEEWATSFKELSKLDVWEVVLVARCVVDGMKGRKQIDDEIANRQECPTCHYVRDLRHIGGVEGLKPVKSCPNGCGDLVTGGAV